MMNCDEINELISLYIDRELSGDQLADFQEHLAGCESCRKEVEELSSLIGACAGIEEEELPENFAQELHKKLVAASAAAEKEKKRPVWAPGKIKWIASVAAGFVVVMIAAFLIKGMILTPSKTESSTRNMAAADKAAQAPEIARYSGSAAQDSGTEAAAGAGSEENASKFAIMPTDDSHGDITVQFGEAKGVQGEETNGSTGETPNEKTPAGSTKQTGESSRGTQTPFAMAMARKVPEKRTVEMTVYSSDTKKAGEELKKLLKENEGETTEKDAEIKATATMKAAADTKVVNCKIPNANFDAFQSAVKIAYGEANVEAAQPKDIDLTASLNDMQKQSDALGQKIKDGEDKKVSFTPEEIKKLKQEKADVDARISETRAQQDFTYVTVMFTVK